MTSSSIDRRVSSLTSILGPAVALLLAVGCSNGGTAKGTGGSASGGTTTSGGATGPGGSTTAAGGTTGAGGTTTNGGTTGRGGTPGSGGVTGSGGTPGSGGVTGSGGLPGSGGTPGSGGVPGTGGAGKGGSTSTGGGTGAGGTTGRDGGPGSGGAPGTGGVAIDGGTSTVDCTATMPSGGQTCTGTSCNGTADGLGYGIWTNGSGGTITYFTNAHAFSTSWSNSQDFLAHLGLDFRPAKAYTAYGTILAEFVENKTATTNPPWSMIGMYGWTNSPCVEWYINEDSFNGLGGGGSITATIDGATYYLKTVQTTGTGGANACESGHSGPWTQMISTRKTARTCGTITVSDHFAAWAAQGWSLGVLTMVHINVEVGGGTGKIDFPVANVTTTSK